MVRFEIAQAAVTVSQYFVNTTRLVLIVADGVREVAKFGLDTAELALD